MALQAILDQVATIVGGTAPNPTGNPGWFSGYDTGDGSGIQSTPTFRGCYSYAPDTIASGFPCAVVFPGPFTATLIAQGEEPNEDILPLFLFLARSDMRRQTPNLTPFRDLVPAVFRSHMQLNKQINLDAFVVSGRPGHFDFAGSMYVGWEFQVRVRTMVQPIYTA